MEVGRGGLLSWYSAGLDMSVYLLVSCVSALFVLVRGPGRDGELHAFSVEFSLIRTSIVT